MRKLFKNKEKKHLNIHIFEWDIDVYAPENEEQRYIKAAENVSKKIEAYMDLYVRQQNVPQKSYMEILLMTLLDIAVTSTDSATYLLSLIRKNDLLPKANNVVVYMARGYEYNHAYDDLRKEERGLYDTVCKIVGQKGNIGSGDLIIDVIPELGRQTLIWVVAYNGKPYANVDKFIRDFYLPKNKEERMSAKLLEEINERLSNTKLDVVTQDVDESGEASVYAKYLPQGFDSWEDYLKTVF